MIPLHSISCLTNTHHFYLVIARIVNYANQGRHHFLEKRYCLRGLGSFILACPLDTVSSSALCRAVSLRVLGAAPGGLRALGLWARQVNKEHRNIS